MARLSETDFFDIFGISQDMWTPKTDVYETETSVVIKIAVSGLLKENVELMLSKDNSVLTVRGVRNEPETDGEEKIKCHRLEIYYGTFERDVELPSNVEIDRKNIYAKYEDGMLTVRLAKQNRRETVSIKIED